MDFVDTLTNAPALLTEGSVVERLRRDDQAQLDAHVEHAGLVHDEAGRTALRNIYRQYLDIGRDHNLPMFISPPTWRASPDRLAAAGLGECAAVNRDCVRFAAEIRDEYGEYARRVYVGGLIGCRGDAYDPSDALPERGAAEFHQTQVRALADAGADFLMAATLPAASEACGIARAMSTCRLPYILSFVVRSSGVLLDGTRLCDAISAIDTGVNPPPLGYMVNCVHPTVFAAALACAANQSADVRARVIGLQANTSPRSPEELDGCEVLETEAPAAFADALLDLHRRFGARILGGCCGTDNRHIRCLAELLVTLSS